MTPARGNEILSLNDQAGVKCILVDTVFGLCGIVNSLTRLRPSRRERYRVTILGSARVKPGTWVCDEVKRLSGVSSPPWAATSSPAAGRG